KSGFVGLARLLLIGNHDEIKNPPTGGFVGQARLLLIGNHDEIKSTNHVVRLHTSMQRREFIAPRGATAGFALYAPFFKGSVWRASSGYGSFAQRRLDQAAFLLAS